ncbi:transcriptional activator NhaR [Oceanicoccus sp. KOV_DT_Chl]|uniref:transcriptional activator NhaR n=1 Tax=Oceanicoccus sp. KOV_DT_Chl TaxID=1904639 RepID=UPI000C7AB9FB|nr:transcriptional activator NhaR [Oceanicoccus sp. KOV_DT_Chl]
MAQMNFHHLHYFFTIAREGSIVKAAEKLHLTPQTLSSQIKTFESYLGVELFDRKGRGLLLNDKGRMVYGYAEDIFSLGYELQQTLQSKNISQQFIFTVGIVDVIPKILAYDLLIPILESQESIRLISREGDFESLLGELAVGKMDLIISDRGLQPGSAVKAYNHILGKSGLTFYAGRSEAKQLKAGFPASMHEKPFLYPGEGSSQKINLSSWFDRLNIQPRIVAEFDDTALMKFFGQSGCGVFCTPSSIEAHVLRQYKVDVIGRTEEIHEQFYAISPERKLKHPGVKKVIDAASQLFTIP